MAAKTTSSPTQKKQKNHWYNNVADGYRIARRSYPWIGWLMGGIGVVASALGVLVGLLVGSVVSSIIAGVLGGAVIDLLVLSILMRRALYAQLEGRAGAVYAVVSQIKRGWIVGEQPIVATREQDLVWRLVGRPGVVLISEGPHSRVHSLLVGEARRVNRVAANVPVTPLEVGTGPGQVRLGALERRVKRLKKVLTKEEVPAVAARLSALASTAMPIPKGVDPHHVHLSRRMLRGR